MSADPSTQICAGCLKVGVAAGSAPVAAGREEQVGGIDCYVTSTPAAAADAEKHAIIICTDIYGWRFPPVRALADVYAAAAKDGRSFTVLVPSYLHDPVRIEDRGTFMSIFKEWIARNPPATMAAKAKQVIEAIKAQYKSVQIVGFCMGARPAVTLLEEAALLDGGVLFHPTLMTEADAALLRDAASPIMLCLADNDVLFSPELRDLFTKTLLAESAPAAKESRAQIFPGTSHGFGVRPEANEVEQSKIANAAACEFFNKNAANAAKKA